MADDAIDQTAAWAIWHMPAELPATEIQGIFNFRIFMRAGTFEGRYAIASDRFDFLASHCFEMFISAGISSTAHQACWPD